MVGGYSFRIYTNPLDSIQFDERDSYDEKTDCFDLSCCCQQCMSLMLFLFSCQFSFRKSNNHFMCCIFAFDLAFEKGMKLPGSRPDVIRSRSTSGPSPVGGSFGGTDSQKVMALDDFEFQAVYYNMACAHARLGNVADSVVNLEKAFKNGFDNYSTVRGDPDLDTIKQSREYNTLMDTYDGNAGGFNPFGLFSKK